MIEAIRRKLENKKIIILGFGREGKSSYRFIRSLFPGMKITIADVKEAVKTEFDSSPDPFLEFETGPTYMDDLDSADLIIKTPGITLKELPVPLAKEKITSQTDLFLLGYAGQVAGITGTKGKSTTSTLMHHILQYAERESLLLGNIGRPALDHTSEIGPLTTIVYEMSSHQLEHLSASPHIAVLLNLYQEHLDAYASFKDYQVAKWNITKYQQPEDFLIYNLDDPLITQLMEEIPTRAQVFGFSLETEPERGCFKKEDQILFRDGEKEEVILDLRKKNKLPGEHNLRNIMAAAIVCRFLKVDTRLVAEGIAGFRGLEHRLEDCGIYHGIHFFNDSIATIPEACMAAVKALEKVDVIILGGFDRGVDYTALAAFLSGSGIQHLLFTGDAGKRIMELFKPNDGQQVYRLERFDQFKDLVLKVAKPGSVCLLSPAAASYDEFPNFEIRGRRFKELIQEP